MSSSAKPVHIFMSFTNRWLQHSNCIHGKPHLGCSSTASVNLAKAAVSSKAKFSSWHSEALAKPALSCSRSQTQRFALSRKVAKLKKAESQRQGPKGSADLVLWLGMRTAHPRSHWENNMQSPRVKILVPTTGNLGSGSHFPWGGWSKSVAEESAYRRWKPRTPLQIFVLSQAKLI